MPVSDEVKKILDGGAWASAGGALTQDPSAATPAVVRADGYGAAYSATLVPEQETIQGRWNEFDSAIIDIFTSGVPFYDAMINYPVNALTNENGVLSRALIANGPTAGNAIAPSADTGGTTWARVSGTTNAPGRPAQPTATSPAPGTLDVSWSPPLDGGSVITGYVFQYREAGGSWPGTERTVTVPRVLLTGLTNGQAYEFRVMAVNAIGDSLWSPTGTGTPTAAAPEGGNALALRADAGDGQVVLNWVEPDDRGSPITSYVVQWRAAGQSFNNTRQRTVTGATTDTVPSLTNGTEYFFQVSAVNGVGTSTASNEATATPVAPPLEGTPSLILENSMLDVDGGSTVALRVKLGGEPSGDVAVALSEMSDLISLSTDTLNFDDTNWDVFQTVTVTAGGGSRQEITLTESHYSQNQGGAVDPKAWSNVPFSLLAGLRGSGTPENTTVTIHVGNDGSFIMNVGSFQTHDLSDTWEMQGSATLTQGVHSATVTPYTVPDTNEPYQWPTGTVPVAFYNAIVQGDATLTLRGYTPGAANIALSASGTPEYADINAVALVTVN